MLAQGILSDLRIVEASNFVAAPLGGLTLAQMGADVIRIDPLGGGLDFSRWPMSNDDVSLFWCGLNKSKRSVALNLGDPEGRELAMSLISAPGEGAGLFVTNFPPRGWLDYDKLKKRRADLIQVTLQGDHKGGSAVDYTVNARVGIPYVTGPVSDDAPVNHVLPAWDVATGHLVATGLLAAERHRSRTGQGQHVKLALEDVALSVMGHLGFIAEAQLGCARGRYGNDLFGAFGRDFACADGRRVIAIGLTLKQWNSLVEATGLAQTIEAIGVQLGLDLAKEGDRFPARRELCAAIGGWIAARSFADVAASFDRAGVCWAPYQTIDELVHTDPACSVENPLFDTVDQSGVGRVLSPRSALRFDAFDARAAGTAPALGEHTEAVLGEVLGIDGAAYGRLHDRGIVHGPW
ncbi:CoA transferase [Bradyrhizobium sp. Leo121]|uniref:CoA transferase n=1 Tax=Bradyrhizobium sp. Leo121 TaxID=1571195 RepID=UPI001029CA67|nr:CoA transferase [Bradyrhizobium sp. Leo121]RZN30753.1 2-methylfumaryl-CoA isomerase [Bradyrhizobium sp. Leo121]